MGFVRICVAVVCLSALPVSAVVRPEVRDGQPRTIEPQTAAAVTERVESTEPSPLGEASRAFLERYGGQWSFRSDRRTGKLGLAAGSGIPLIPGKGNQLGPDAAAGLERVDGLITVESLEPRVRAMVDANGALLVPARGKLTLNRDSSQSRDDGRLYSFHYDWTIDGIPVDGADLFVRVNSGNVTQLGTILVGPIELDTSPEVSSADAVHRVLKYAGHEDLARPLGDPELAIQPSDGNGSIDYRLVWKYSYRIHGEIETWEGRVDAHSGELVGFRDTNHYARAVGGVYPRTVTDPEVRVPMPLLDVTVNGSSMVADKAGAFPFTGGVTSAGLDGRFFDTVCVGCSDPADPQVETTAGIGRIDFGVGGQDEFGNGLSTPADRNSFYHLNQVRLVALKWLPNLSWLGSLNFTSNVNINNNCNAVYTGNAVNFYRSGGGCNNTGEISDVMHHEWGHGLDGNTNSGDGGTGEGTADVTALHMSHGPQVGPYFNTNGGPVRNLDSNVSSLGVLTYGDVQAGECFVPQIGADSVHCIGQTYGQTAWDLSQALAAKHGHHTGWRSSERLYFTSLPDADTLVPNNPGSIYSAYINADDDDGNLANGTPNAGEIYTAFNTHEIAEQPYATSPACARPTQPQLTLDVECDRFELSWDDVPGVDHYEVFRSQLREDTAYLPIGDLPAGQTTFTDTEVAPDVDYWYTVMAVDAGGCESTIEAPQYGRLPSQPILSVTTVFDDDEPRGNRSGFPDPGEEVDLVVMMKNFGESASSIQGTISSAVAGVTILEETSPWSPLDTDDESLNLTTLRFATDDQQVACGDLLQFELTPEDTSVCPGETSFFSVRLGEPDGQGGFVCDATPACFVKPDFDGLQTIQSGSSCGEIDLGWQTAISNCQNATISYNIYRDTSPGFAPGPGNLLAEGVSATSFVDVQLPPGQTFHYVVRANDSRSGEEENVVSSAAASPVTPDLGAPLFAGLDASASGQNCGETSLAWGTATESCSGPVSYSVYRSTDPAFVPGPATQIGSTFATDFVDAALEPGVDYTYIVRARDDVGNEEANAVALTVPALALDLELNNVTFEQDAGWRIISPNDAETGNWERGDPEMTNFQPENDATPAPGVDCWFTGLNSGSGNGSFDIDGGTTTLFSSSYSLAGAVDPIVRYRQWFTNDRGGSPGDATDTFLVEVSNDDGFNWTFLDETGAGTPLAWEQIEIPLNGVIAAAPKMRFRFTARDLGSGSLVEAGIDDFQLIDRGQGCNSCATPVATVGTILVNKSGGDAFLDWSADPAPGTRFGVYKLVGDEYETAILIGTTTDRTFMHFGALASGESFSYRVSAIDDCGNQSELE